MCAPVTRESEALGLHRSPTTEQKTATGEFAAADLGRMPPETNHRRPFPATCCRRRTRAAMSPPLPTSRARRDSGKALPISGEGVQRRLLHCLRDPQQGASWLPYEQPTSHEELGPSPSRRAGPPVAGHRTPHTLGQSHTLRNAMLNRLQDIRPRHHYHTHTPSHETRRH